MTYEQLRTAPAAYYGWCDVCQREYPDTAELQIETWSIEECRRWIRWIERQREGLINKAEWLNWIRDKGTEL